jgi:pimeloyl-ACP methyl ester carboxylesterase
MNKFISENFWNQGISWLSEAYDYMFDRSQRIILFYDVLRKRGNIYLEHLDAGQPPILIFDYEVVLDGRNFDPPVNYSLARILERRKKDSGNPENLEKQRRKTHRGKTLDAEGSPSRPIVIIDPRAGHGPGIGGSKLDSQIGVALEYGHPVYFILFSTDPESGQTISRIQNAEILFLKEVVSRHPNSPKPAVIGNCQAGWAAALIGADCPEVVGSMIFNGSPLSYWGGVEGTNPMRYKGGLTGGIWQASLWSDLGNDIFDGANLVSGFEDLNPANTYWTKYYHLFSNVDTEEQRFLRFEKWWGGFFKMTAEEIHFIVKRLFIGNELEKGQLQMDDGRRIVLKNFQTPILAFASEGDNITPPPQALNWIHKVYGTVDEIKRCGQIIIYMVHKRIGHLGIFVSGSVARKEHSQIIGNMGWFEYLAPGLYEMVIEESSNSDGLDDYTVRFEERQMEDIYELDDGMVDEEQFEVVNQVSRLNDLAYKTFVSPWLRSLINEPTAEFIRQLHPLRMQRYALSDRNPFCMPIEGLAERVRSQRKVVSQNNFFIQYEELLSDSLKNSLDYFRDLRDSSQEFVFKSIYDNPWMKTFFGTTKDTVEELPMTNKKIFRATEKEKVRLRKLAEKGGFIEASIRVMRVVAGADLSIDILEFEAAETIIQKSKRLRMLNPEQYKQINKEQALILHAAPRKALTSLAQMELSSRDKKRLYDVAVQIALADEKSQTREKGILKRLHRILFS